MYNDEDSKSHKYSCLLYTSSNSSNSSDRARAQIAQAVAFAYAMLDPNSVCQGAASTGLTRINYAPVTVYGIARYRIELPASLVWQPSNLAGNVPNINIPWSRTSSPKLFSGHIEVWYWDSGIFYIKAFSTYWLDFRTGSDYPMDLTMKVKDVSIWHYPSTTGSDTLSILWCGGPESTPPK